MDCLNIFDGLIVIISLIDSILNMSNNSISGGGYIWYAFLK